MRILKNRKTAVCITICVAVLAVLLGIHRSLNRLSQDIDSLFYSEGYGQTNIEPSLKKQAESALGILTIIENYPELSARAEELSQARRELVSAESISDKGFAHMRLCSVLELMFNLGMGNNESYNNTGVLFNERDESALLQYLGTFSGASYVIDSGKELYNAEAERFLSGDAYSPLVRLLRPFAFVSKPQLFINTQ